MKEMEGKKKRKKERVLEIKCFSAQGSKDRIFYRRCFEPNKCNFIYVNKKEAAYVSLLKFYFRYFQRK